MFGRIASRAARPLAVYAAIEVGAALLALAVPLVFRVYDPIYASLYEDLIGRRELFVLLKFALAFVAMLPPAFLLGGTLPLLATAFVGDHGRLGRAGGTLYAVNTLGAAFGSAAGVLALPEWIGVPGTYATAIALSLVAASGAFALARAGVGARLAAHAESEAVARAPRALLAVAFASGFGTLALEVLLIQAIAQVLDHSIYSYGAVLVVVLLTLSIGASLAAASDGRIAPARLLGVALAGEALLLFVVPAATWALHAAGFSGHLGGGFLAATLLGGPPLLVGALVLPLTFQLASGGSVGRRIGGLLAANTVGGILGSLAASFVLQGGLGLWLSIVAVGLGYGAASLLAAGGARERGVRALVVAAGAALLFASNASPLRLPVVALERGDRLVDHAEGASGVVSVIDSAFGRRMKLNSHYTLEGAGRLIAAKERAGHLPLLLHPKPRRVAFVGSATGSTAGAAVLHPVEHIDLIEIVPEVHALAAKWFADTNHARAHATPARASWSRTAATTCAPRASVTTSSSPISSRPGTRALDRSTRRAFPRGPRPSRARRPLLPVASGLPGDGGDLRHDRRDLSRRVPERAGVPRRSLCALGAAHRADRIPRCAAVVEAVEARLRELAAAGVTDRWVTRSARLLPALRGPARRRGAAARERARATPTPTRASSSWAAASRWRVARPSCATTSPRFAEAIAVPTGPVRPSPAVSTRRATAPRW